MLHSIQYLLLMLPHISLMPELYLKHPNPIQGLLQQLLHIICLHFRLLFDSWFPLRGNHTSQQSNPCCLSIYSSQVATEGYRYTEQCRKALSRIKNDVQLKT